jgi:hypothetical protein
MVLRVYTNDTSITTRWRPKPRPLVAREHAGAGQQIVVETNAFSHSSEAFWDDVIRHRRNHYEIMVARYWAWPILDSAHRALGWVPPWPTRRVVTTSTTPHRQNLRLVFAARKPPGKVCRPRPPLPGGQGG